LSAAEECGLNPKDAFKECDLCPEMVVVQAGSFMMGSPSDEEGRSKDEGPQHRVTILRAFAVGKYTVTVDQFSDFVQEAAYDAGTKCQTNGEGKWEESDSFLNPGFSQTGSHPAVCLSWNDAKAYVAWLSKKTGKSYSLLTEAEWEYAARAGSSTRYFFGNNEDDICRYANGVDRTAETEGKGKMVRAEGSVATCSDGYIYTAPVGSFLPNAFGLYDMVGNAWQWLEDCSANYNNAPTDGSAWSPGYGSCEWHRSLRGGGWNSTPRLFRSAARSFGYSDGRINVYGFRVARTLSP
jgi:formylglycine-generating enzyme required for sulfatase activity